MIGLLLIGGALAVPPTPFADARAMLEQIKAVKNGTAVIVPVDAAPVPTLCYQIDDVDAYVLAVHTPGVGLESVDGPRGPTVADTVALLPVESEWAAVDPESVGACPVAVAAVDVEP